MKTYVEIWNGGGWNNYQALRTLKTLKAGTRGLAAKQGVSKIEVAPYDTYKPLGIRASYFDASGDELYTQRFDQNDSAKCIRAQIYALLKFGVRNRIKANAARIARKEFVIKITAWRRNFDAKFGMDGGKKFDRLSVKFHAMRRATLRGSPRPSRGLCTALAGRVVNGGCTYREAVNAIVAAGGIAE